MSLKKNILIVEDELLYASRLEMQLELLGYTVVGSADSSETALDMIRENDVDLILMDIHIQGNYDGVELTEQVQKIQPVPVIFLTSQEDEMTFKRAARTKPAGFILKPCSDVQLQRSIQLALDQEKQETISDSDQEATRVIEEDLFIQKNQTVHRVPIRSIEYLEADGRYCRVHCDLGLFLVRKPLKELLKLLPESHFIQCHRSYVINLQQVEKIDLEDDQIVLKSHRIPVSKREREHVLERLRLLK
ncbi:MAG: response regulator [Lewinellaceae bacterium]|nr:response regulator [Lewinellaceae bacterium]